MAGWQDFIRAIRKDEDEEKKRDQVGGAGNRIFGFIDDVLDVGERTGQAARKQFASIDNGGDNDYDVFDVIRDTPRAFGDAVVKTADDIREFGEDSLQSLARFGAESAMSTKEAFQDQGFLGWEGDDDRRNRIDSMLSMSREERERIANDKNDPRSFMFDLTRKQLGNLDDETLNKRKTEINEKDAANDEWRPTSGFGKAIFGGEEDERSRTIQKRTADYRESINKAGKDAGVNQGLVSAADDPLAIVGAVGAMALDSPFGKPVALGAKAAKEVGKEGIEQIAKSVDPDDILNILKKSKTITKLGDDTMRAAAEALKGVDNAKEVNKLLKGIKKIKPQAATTDIAKGFPVDAAVRQQIDEVTPTTPVPEGMTRLYQGTENGQPTDWYFNDPDKLARYYTGRDQNVSFRTVDVPTESASPMPRRDGVFRVSDVVPDATTPPRQISPLADEMAAGYNNTDEVIDDIVDHWWQYDKNAKGGQLINRTGAGDAGPDDIARISEHSPFYSRYYKENGRKPSKAALREEVVRQLDQGEGDLILGQEVSDAYGLVRDRVSSMRGIDATAPVSTPSGFTDVVRGGAGTPPVDPLNPTTNVGPGRTRLRSFLQTAQKSDALTDDTKTAISQVDPQRYTQEQQAPIMEEARQLVESSPDQARQILEEKGQFDARRSAIFQQYIRKLSQEGNAREAAEYAERLSNETLTAGRGNAMIAAMNRLSPEGILIFANKTVERYTKQAKKGILNRISNMGKESVDDAAKSIRTEVESAGKVTKENVEKAIKDIVDGDPDAPKSVGEKVATRVGNIVDPPKKKKKVDELVNELTKKIRQEQLAPKPAGPKRTAKDILQEVFKREGEAQEAWPEAQEILKERFADNPEVLEQLEKFFASNLDNRIINAKSTLDTAVKETLRANETKIIDVIQKSWDDQAKTIDDLVQDLTKEGFSPEAAEIIAKQATENLQKQVIDAKKRMLDNLMKQVPERARPTFEEKIAKLSNIGALDDKDYLQIAQKRLNLPSLDDATAKKISEIAQKMQGLPDGPEKDEAIRDIMDAIADTLPVTAKEKFEAFRYQNLLSSPRTQLRNVLANSFNTLVTRPATLFTGAAGDTVSTMFTGKPRERYFSELPEYYKGIVKGFFDSHEAMAAAWKGTADLSNPDFADVFGQTGIDQARRRQIPKKWTVVSRLMEAQDKMFSGMIAGGEYAAQIKRGVPEEVAREAAHNMAEYSLLRQALDPKNATGQGDMLSKIDQASAALTDLANKAPGGRWVIPFIRTPLNFTKQWLEFSPVGLTDAAIGKGMSPERRIEALNKGLLGTSVMGIGATLVADDRVTWAVPENEKERDLFYAEGKKPYSVKIGDQWIPLINFGPFGLAMAVPAGVKYNFTQSADSMNQDFSDKVVATALDVGEMLSQQTFLNGLGALIEALQSQNGDQVEKVLANFGTQVIPLSGLQRYVATIVDPTYREPKGFTENLTAGIPGFSKNMEAQENSVTGEPITRNWSDYLAPYSIGQENPDPVRQENTEMTSMFYQALRRGGDDRTKTNEKITEALSQGNAQEAMRLATEHNQRVSQSLQEFRVKYGPLLKDNPDLLNIFMRDYQSALISNPLSRDSLRSRSSGILKKENINSALNQ